MRIFLISNMYPSHKDKLFGVFVKNFKLGLEKNDIVFTQNSLIYGKSPILYKKIIKYIRYFKSIIINLFKAEHDLIYIHYLSINSIILRCVSFILNLNPIVVNVHGSDVTKEGYFMNFFNEFLLKKSILIIAPSDYFKRVLLAKYNFLDEDKIFVSPSAGIDLEVFYPKKIAKESTLTLGFISRIDSGKGWDLFIDLISLLKSKDIDVKGIVVGDGLERDKFLKQIDKHNLDDVIDYRGFVKQEKLVDVINLFDIFIFPTMLFESLGLVGLESMACGVPIISSNIGGPSEYIIDGVNGYKFKAGNFNELFSRVLEFLSLSDNEVSSLRMEAIKTSIEYDNKLVMKNLTNKLLAI